MVTEVPDGDHRDDEQSNDEKPRGQQRRRRQDGLPPYGLARLQQQALSSAAQRMLSSPAFREKLRITNLALSSSALANYSKIAPHLPAMTATVDMATKAIRGYPLQNWATISSAANSAATWAEISGSLRNLIKDYFPVQSVGAWVDSLRLDHYPPNWPADLRIEEVRELADEEGIPLCWVPRAAVIHSLRTADSADRRNALIAHHEDVLEDCASALGEVLAPELKEYREAAEDVLAAMRDGHHRPAQALAMNVVDAALRGTLFDDVSGFKFYGPVVKRIEKTRDCQMQDFRRSATLWPLLRLFKHFSPGQDGVPDRPNRHATAHTVDGVQYTPVNALIASMFAASVIREVQESLILEGRAPGPGELEAGPSDDGPGAE